VCVKGKKPKKKNVNHGKFHQYRIGQQNRGIDDYSDDKTATAVSVAELVPIYLIFWEL